MLSVLRLREFRLLWLGQSISLLGDGLVIVAIGLYVTRLTGNPADVGLVLAAYAIPLVAFVLLGGVLADRLPRQRVMVASDTILAVLHAVLAVLILTGAVRIWQMVVIGMLFGTAEAFFRPAYTGLVPQTVGEDRIQDAQALSGVSAQISEVASPALATALVLGVGASAAFALDALSFVVSALLLIQFAAVTVWDVWAAWVFIAGRVLHTAVQTKSSNVQLRGLVFGINALAVFVLVGHVAVLAWGFA